MQRRARETARAAARVASAARAARWAAARAREWLKYRVRAITAEPHRTRPIETAVSRVDCSSATGSDSLDTDQELGAEREVAHGNDRSDQLRYSRAARIASARASRRRASSAVTLADRSGSFLIWRISSRTTSAAAISRPRAYPRRYE